MEKEEILENENIEISEEVTEEDFVEEIIEESIQEAIEVEQAENYSTIETILKNENKELKDRLVRSAAEFDNFRKRTTKEKQTMYSEGVKDTVEKLLAITDNFDRAMNAKGINKEDSFYIGMDMIFKQFNALLDELGVKEIGEIGDIFDPTVHFAVAKEEVDGYEENAIIEILQKGYKLNEKVIRPTMVKVNA